MQRQILEIDIEEIDIDSYQPRQDFVSEKAIERLQNLADDIKDKGQIVPIIVTAYCKVNGKEIIGKDAFGRKDTRWLIIDGHRRLLVTRDYLNKHKIDVDIKRDITKVQALEMQFAANSKREAIPIEEMEKAYQRFVLACKEEGIDIKEVKQRLAKATGHTLSYFKDIERLSIEKDKEVKEYEINDDLSAHYSAERDNASKDVNIKKGLNKAYKKVVKMRKKEGKKKGPSILKMRILKQDGTLDKIAKSNKTAKAKEKLVESLMTEVLLGKSEGLDKRPDFNKYLNHIEALYEKVQKWNIKDLNEDELSELVKAVNKILKHLKG